VRTILAIVAGIAVAFGVVALADFFIHQLFDMPAVPTNATRERLATYVTEMPLGAKFGVVSSWLLATLLGSYAAIKIATARKALAAMVSTGALLAATLANVLMIPHPLWMVAAGCLGIPIACSLALRLANILPSPHAHIGT
jgi:hypothetical protein